MHGVRHLLECSYARRFEADLVRRWFIEVWSEWREGRTPTLAEAVGAFIWYAEHDTYQRTDPDAGDGRVRVWP
ncbi:hypothetical protein [Trebonia sp.]|uniref:hypothetical protein n=1 Tax=Trebonia sp. TaxID=2767075 RepID=UPI00261FB425|nr:hypothetical protein [Trebonia sp.]